MNKTEQCTVAGAIYGLIGLVFLAAFGMAVYAVFTTLREAFIPMAALFGIFGFGATYASWYAFSHAMQS